MKISQKQIEESINAIPAFFARRIQTVLTKQEFIRLQNQAVDQLDGIAFLFIGDRSLTLQITKAKLDILSKTYRQPYSIEIEHDIECLDEHCLGECLKKICYQCEESVDYLFSDSRCKNCTRENLDIDNPYLNLHEQKQELTKEKTQPLLKCPDCQNEYHQDNPLQNYDCFNDDCDGTFFEQINALTKNSGDACHHSDQSPDAVGQNGTIVCPTCNGVGIDQLDISPCDDCLGKGRQIVHFPDHDNHCQCQSCQPYGPGLQPSFKITQFEVIL